MNVSYKFYEGVPLKYGVCSTPMFNGRIVDTFDSHSCSGAGETLVRCVRQGDLCPGHGVHG
jgi:hypothetical protein